MRRIKLKILTTIKNNSRIQIYVRRNHLNFSPLLKYGTITDHHRCYDKMILDRSQVRGLVYGRGLPPLPASNNVFKQAFKIALGTTRLKKPFKSIRPQRF